MAKLTKIFGTTRQGKDHKSFETSAYVDSSGNFYAPIPDDIQGKLGNTTKAGVRCSHVGKHGLCATAKSMHELQEVLDKCAAIAFSRELISSTLMIKYNVSTCASYVKLPDGQLVPNGGYGWIGDLKWGEDVDWSSGTIRSNAANPYPTGVQVHAEVVLALLYKKSDGGTMEEELRVTDDQSQTEERLEHEGVTYPLPYDSYNFIFLAGLVASSGATGSSGLTRIEYSEPVAAVFVSMIKSLWMINERLKDINKPETILEIASGGTKLLS